MARVKSAKDEKIELIQNAIDGLNEELSNLGAKKHWFTRQSKLDQQKAEIQRQIAALTSIKNNLSRRTRGIKRVKRGIISGIVVDRMIYPNYARKEKKEQALNSRKASVTSQKASLLARGLGGVDKLTKMEEKLQKKIDKAKGKKIKAEGHARRILLPKFTRENHLDLQVARQRGVYDYRKNKYDSMEAVANANRSLGTIRGAIKAAAYDIGRNIYKKRVDHAANWITRLRNKAPVYKGSKGLLRAKAMGMIGRHL